jgi:hypothetical protein
MKKYRIKHHDTSLLFFTPFAFLNMDGTVTYDIQERKGWWIFGKWESIYKTKNITDAYKKYFSLKYDIKISQYREFPHNRKKGEYVTCELEFSNNSHTKDYIVGYKPVRYIRYYYCSTSKISYEQALMNLYNDLLVQDAIKKTNK